ncbi:protein RICE SALT SENSITIVE 3-like [Bidens hawaiensis]|uniref:protein RICE SALT SENSITIVE 3-like n=1 Tax=Bidens hawaiensis TaxID=980011 RepID=UPI00404B51F2
MEGLPMLTCLIQHTLKTLCTCSSSLEDNSSSKWVYSVFWRILPRIYPPPKWDAEGGVLDRAKGNKRNCEVFLVKIDREIASDNSHKWVFKDGLNEHDPSFISSWNASIDPQPKAWEFHFNSGIKTIAIISTREGIIQLGSFDKILEDMNLVLNIQRKFNYLRTIPGLFSIQRPLSNVQHSYNPLKDRSDTGPEEAQKLTGPKVNIHGAESQPYKGPIWSFGSGYINQESVRLGSHGPPFWPIPPLLPYNYGCHVSGNGNQSRVEDPDQELEKKPICFSPNPEFVMELGSGPKRGAQENGVKSQLN